MTTVLIYVGWSLFVVLLVLFAVGLGLAAQRADKDMYNEVPNYWNRKDNE